MESNIQYQRWLDKVEGELKDALSIMNKAEVEDAFFRDLAFGTGGLRGVLGVGTNRMDIHPSSFKYSSSR